MESDLSTSASSETQSAVSWGAILAGAVAGLALSVVLAALAAGFGLKLASPWPGGRADLAGFTPILGSSMIVVQVLSGALGGYLAGRLRTRWIHAHGHEVHFRDTAHGLLAWAVSTLMGIVLVATVLAPAAGPVTSAIVDSAATQINGAAPTTGYVADVAAPADPAARLRMERAANISAQFSFFMGFGLLLGAFTACVAAAIGGLRREEMHTRFWTEHARAGRP